MRYLINCEASDAQLKNAEMTYNVMPIKAEDQVRVFWRVVPKSIGNELQNVTLLIGSFVHIFGPTAKDVGLLFLKADISIAIFKFGDTSNKCTWSLSCGRMLLTCSPCCLASCWSYVMLHHHLSPTPGVAQMSVFKDAFRSPENFKSARSLNPSLQFYWAGNGSLAM